MKKIMAFLTLATVMTAGALSTEVFAEDTNRVYLVSDKGSVNDTVSVSVVIDSDTYQLSGITYSLNYDSDSLELQGDPVLNEVFTNGLKQINTDIKGVVDVVYVGFDEGAAFHDKEIMTLSFKVLKVNSEITIDLAEINNFSENSEDISSSFSVENTIVQCSHKNTSTKTEITDCEQGGKKITTCKDCGETVKTEDIAPADHTVDKWIETKKATCTENGEEEGSCTVCGKTVTRETEMAEHTYGEWEVTTEPTCTDKGVETKTCSVCGKTETRDVDALGHDFGEWITVKAATCTEKGSEERKCSRCDVKETRETEMIDHTIDWKTTKEPTCTEKGEKTGTCTLCGKTETEEIPALGHDWSEWKVVEEPTTEKEGKEERECKVCGEKETRATQKLPAPITESSATTEPDVTTESGVTTTAPSSNNAGGDKADGNVPTGVFLAIIPVAAACAGVVIFKKKRK